jgi:hypothetical protein
VGRGYVAGVGGGRVGHGRAAAMRSGPRALTPWQRPAVVWSVLGRAGFAPLPFSLAYCPWYPFGGWLGDVSELNLGPPYGGADPVSLQVGPPYGGADPVTQGHRRCGSLSTCKSGHLKGVQIP